MNLIENELYRADVSYVAAMPLPWEKFAGKTFLISGASGLIGSFFTDVLLFRNQKTNMDARVLAIGRNEAAAKERFSYCWNEPSFHFIAHDINEPLTGEDFSEADVVLHLASNTHPVAYAKDPIGTIAANIIGLKNMLDFAVKSRAARFAFASSNEIYGENRGDTETFDEGYCGYIDCNTLRAGYPESKRCGEALCQAYRSQCGLNVVLPRLTRSYGPTLRQSDTKAMSQFLRNALQGEDIVLKSAGNQYYSYTYVADAVSGLLTVLLCGKGGEAYNVADAASDIRLKDLAGIIAAYAGRKVIFELPDAAEQAGYSRATKARLDSTKLQGLGWKAKYDIQTGVERTLDIMKALKL